MQQTVSPVCSEQVKQFKELSRLTRLAVKPYLNMSNQSQFILKISPDLKQIAGLPEILPSLLAQYDMVDLKVSAGDRKAFQQFLKQLDTLNVRQKQRLMISFDLPRSDQASAWRNVQQDLFAIQRIGIQKFGVDGYEFANAEKVQGYLYNPLSGNSSPTMYRPFTGSTVQGQK